MSVRDTRFKTLSEPVQRLLIERGVVTEPQAADVLRVVLAEATESSSPSRSDVESALRVLGDAGEVGGPLEAEVPCRPLGAVQPGETDETNGTEKPG